MLVTVKYILVISILIGVSIVLEGCESSFVHHVGTCLIQRSVNLTGHTVHIGLFTEEILLVQLQVMPIPPGDHVVQFIAVALTVDERLVILFGRTDLTLIAILVHGLIRIEIRLDVHQSQFTM